jgi:hypothetical protein
VRRRENSHVGEIVADEASGLGRAVALLNDISEQMGNVARGTSSAEIEEAAD